MHDRKRSVNGCLSYIAGTGISPEDTTFSPLTEREMEILQQIIEGLSNKEIAITHRNQPTDGQESRHLDSGKVEPVRSTQAAIHALRHGWVRLQKL